MSRPSKQRVMIAADSTTLQFRASLGMCVALAVVFSLSWQQHGAWPLIEGALMCGSLAFTSYSLLLTLRVQTVRSSSSIRPWMRPTAFGILIFAFVIGSATLWRMRA